MLRARNLPVPERLTLKFCVRVGHGWPAHLRTTAIQRSPWFTVRSATMQRPPHVECSSASSPSEPPRDRSKVFHTLPREGQFYFHSSLSAARTTLADTNC